MTTLDIYVDGSPRTKGSWTPIRRRDGGTFMKPSTDEKPWAMAVAWSARAARPKLIAKPRAVSVTLTFDMPTPKRSKNDFPMGDVDKLARSVLDALTGICWDDDVQVERLTVLKRFGEHTGAQIRVEQES